MRGSLVRARRASISSAGLQWACMSIMAVLLSLSSNGLTPKIPVCGRSFPNYRAIYFNRHSEASAYPAPLLLGWGLALKYQGGASILIVPAYPLHREFEPILIATFGHQVEELVGAI